MHNPWFHALPFALAVAAISAPAMAQAAQPFNIPAGNLADTLNSIASQGGLVLSLDPSLVSGKQAPAIHGEMTATQALQKAVAGSGLDVLVTSGGNVTLVPALSNEQALELSSVTISGKAPGSITEGTGSYTTGSTSSSTRLNLTPQETPQSITVITQQRMEDQKLDSLVDVLDATTGVVIKTLSMGADTPQIWARGSSINNFQVDGVPTISSLNNYLQSTIAYDRIEVVRGATGMMSGMGYPSATINMVRKRPTYEAQASIRGEAGSWDRYGTGFDVSGPLTDNGNVRGRLAADYKTQHAWTDNYEQENTAVYGIAEIDLDENTLLSMGFNHLKKHTDSQTRMFPLLDSVGNKVPSNASDNDSPAWSYYDHQSNNVFASLEHRFDSGWSIKSELSHTQYQYDGLVAAFQGRVNQVTGTGASIQSNHYASTVNQDTLDVYLTGPFSLLGREHELITGLTLADTDIETPNYLQTTPTYSIPNFWDFSRTTAIPGFRKNGKVETSEYQYSAYLSSRFRLTDDTRLLVGGRVTDWKRNRDTSNTDNGSKSKTTGRESGVFIPYVGVTHALDETWSLYASYTKIFNPQLYYVVDINQQPLMPEEGTSYETGIKASFNEGRMNASLSVFKTEQDNIGEWDSDSRTYTPLNGIDTQGVEVEFNGQLAEGWNLSSGYVYSTTMDAEDQRVLTRAPRHSLKTFTTYRLPGNLEKFTVGGGFNWESKTGTDLHVFSQSSYAVFNLMGRYNISRNLTASININNLFDKEYVLADNGLNGTWGAPRNFMTSFKYSF
ncbi:TonB-dependent receptor [Pseudomonas sp. 21LCFQ010]|uniref:TonB-dependent siderophore receptor n=1 Tax=Pseudomonas sp. 21LCFQ010 TaxID=2957506 RepID=UPI002096E649|nr:TonB-dependent receptor [Pseudomonas sp. 21LCFQ010]